MNYSLRIFKLFGIPVELHISFLLLMLFIYAVAILNLIPGLDIYYAILITMLFVTVVLHELSHSYLALRYGINIERIVLFPIGGVSELEEMPREPRQELRIALAGPLVNFIIAGVCYLILFLAGNFLTNNWISFINDFILVNLVLGGFNLLPAYPMDGGRVLRAYLAGKMNFVKATELAAQTGKFLAILMSLAGIFLLNIFLVLVALFVYIGAEQEYKMIMVSSLLEGIKVTDIMTSPVKSVSSESTVKEVMDIMFREKHMGYPVMEDDKLIGIITFHDIAKIRDLERDQIVKNFMTSKVEVTSPEEPLLDSWEKLNQLDVGRLPVVENGHIVGIISKTDIMRALEMMKLKKIK